MEIRRGAPNYTNLAKFGVPSLMTEKRYPRISSTQWQRLMQERGLRLMRQGTDHPPVPRPVATPSGPVAPTRAGHHDDGGDDEDDTEEDER
jgi:hypothetical protein